MPDGDGAPPIAELGHMFALQPDVSIAFLHNDLLFYILRSLSPLSAQRHLFSTSKHTPEPAIKTFSDSYQVWHRIDPERKADSPLRPPVKMRGQGKIRIPSQQARSKTPHTNPMARSIHRTAPS